MPTVSHANASHFYDPFFNEQNLPVGAIATKKSEQRPAPGKIKYNYHGKLATLRTQISQAMGLSGDKAKFSVDLSTMKSVGCDGEKKTYLRGLQCLGFEAFAYSRGVKVVTPTHLVEVVRAIFASASQHPQKNFNVEVVIADKTLKDQLIDDYISRSKPSNVTLKFVEKSSFLNVIEWRTPLR